MKRSERAVLLKADDVLAILSGEKKQLLIPIRPKPVAKLAFCMAGWGAGTWGYCPTGAENWGDPEYLLPAGTIKETTARRWTPPCRTDDVLYVRETWAYGYIESGDREYVTEEWFEELDPKKDNGRYLDAISGFFYRADMVLRDPYHMKWRPSVTMPKNAARLFLQVKHVAVQKDSSAGREAPWMWVVDFERCDKPKGWMTRWDTSEKGSISAISASSQAVGTDTMTCTESFGDVRSAEELFAPSVCEMPSEKRATGE